MDSIPVDYGQSDTAIVITASRLPGGDPAAASTIFGESKLDRLGEPGVVDYLRLVPSVSVSTSGPAGSLTEVRHPRRGGQPYFVVCRWHSRQRPPPPVTRRGSSCSMSISPTASRSSADRNRRYGAPKRLAVSSRSMAR